VTCQFESGYGF